MNFSKIPFNGEQVDQIFEFYFKETEEHIKFIIIGNSLEATIICENIEVSKIQ
ncbi:hypothetical protein ACAG39_05125 [Caldicellulosiruptoraceae bacterium PP1]